jgi:hypothetical protein
MSRLTFLPACRLALGMLVGVTAHAQLHADDSIGVARISSRSNTVVRAQSPEDGAPAPIADTVATDAAPIQQTQCAAEPGMSCPSHCPGTCPSGCPFGGTGGGLFGSHGCPEGDFVSMSCPAHRGIFDPSCPDCRFFSQQAGYGNCPPGCEPRCGSLFFERCGKFCTGCGDKLFDMCGSMDDLFGKNAGQPLFGHYKIVYPVNPGYFDGRDGQVYAAQGYGGPVSVPLAPVVRHTYNYGWGVPSSRLTPISRPIPRGGRP